MKVKCADCGFLAVRHFETRQLLDAEPLFRSRGYIPSVTVGKGADSRAYDEHPVCFANYINFRTPEEAGISASEGTRRDAVQKERECPHFTQWQQGFTPKEHREMIQQAELMRLQNERDRADREDRAARDRHQHEADRRRDEYQAQKDKEAREYQTARDKENHDFQSEQARLNRQHADRMFKLQAAGLLLAVATAIASSALWFLGVSRDKAAPERQQSAVASPD